MMPGINSRVLSHQGLRNRVDPEFMSGPEPYPSTLSGVELQTHEYRPLAGDDEAVINPFSVSNIYVFLLDKARQQLAEIHQEAADAYALDNEIDPVPESAYDDARFFLEILFHAGIPLPDISWAEDGSLSFEWFPEDGIVTMGIYGDGLVIYTAFFEEKRQVEGICKLSDDALLSGFLATLLSLHF